MDIKTAMSKLSNIPEERIVFMKVMEKKTRIYSSFLLYLIGCVLMLIFRGLYIFI